MKKKKIAIITTHHYPNYGNKLQNYALQKVLQKMGFHAETINDTRSFGNMVSFWSQWKNLMHYVLRFIHTADYSRVLFARFYLFSVFRMSWSKITIREDADARGLETMYDYFVVGSDQIWNPEWPRFSNPFGFATFARKEQKVAYAPSLGISQMLKERESEYREFLKDWKALSCREYEGAKILEALSGQEVPVVVDPTLLVTPIEWSRLSRRPNIKSKYVLLYMIGQMENEYQEYVDDFVKETGLVLVDLRDENKNQGKGPREFLGLVKNAEYVITDSFHGSAFAIQFHKPFTLFQRSKPNELGKMSRITTLFSHAGISVDKLGIISEFNDLDWEHVELSINEKRREGLEFLINNLT